MLNLSKRMRLITAILSVIVIISMLAACAPQATQTQAPTEQKPAEQQPTEKPSVQKPAETKKFTIGVSNSFVGSEWRTQMIKNMQEINAKWMEEGLTNELVIENADTDVQGQTQQIRNLMNKGVNAIVVNPGDAAGLNPVLEEAIAAGIVVISIDQEVTAKGAYNVCIDQKEWAKTSARWLVEKLGGKGKVVALNGVTGHPANVARVAGWTEVFKEAGIEVLNSVDANWDEATGQQKMADFLASYPEIDGVWSQDGVSLGALRAVEAANLEKWPVMIGEARAGYIQEWKKVLENKPGFETIGVINPPGQGADGLKVALRLLQGEKIKADALKGANGNTLYVPLPGVVTKYNFDIIHNTEADKTAWHTVDSILTDEQVDQWFEGAPETKKFTIGVSNSFVGSEWRTQMINNMQEVNKQFMEAGITNELIIENADTDVQGQTQQIRNLMNKGVNAIVVNPGDAAGLNPVIEEALAAGILVISIDQEVTAKGAINVCIDQKEWAKTSARWLVEKLGGKGKVVALNGVTGHPANVARIAGWTEVFKEAGIEVLNSVDANWDEATGQQKMADFLASYPEIDGVWSQDGVSLGALRAVEAANLAKWPVMVGEARAGYIQEWKKVLETKPDFETIGVVNPPGQGADGLLVAIYMLQGKQIKDGILAGANGNTIYVKIPGVVTKDNFESYYEALKDKSAWYTVDYVMSPLEVNALFK
ncbi:MAG: ABC transporter substrate-binding protein [Anaerolineales bacterium]|nr:ABC transporter substrate-binding protein [Anaerolineales bacterium]